MTYAWFVVLKEYHDQDPEAVRLMLENREFRDKIFKRLRAERGELLDAAIDETEKRDGERSKPRGLPELAARH